MKLFNICIAATLLAGMPAVANQNLLPSESISESKSTVKTMQLAMNSAHGQKRHRFNRRARRRAKTGRYIPRSHSRRVMIKTRVREMRPGFRPGFGFSAKPTVLADTYCHDTNPNYPACDDNFTKKCSGTVSGVQGWGGKTCFTRSGGVAPE